MIFQAGVTSKWTNDSQRFLLEHFDAIHSFPSQIYHSALPLSPPSWLHKCYSAVLSPTVKAVKGLPTEWGACSRTVELDSYISISTLSYHDSKVAVGSQPGDIIILDIITGIQTAILSGHRDEVNCVTFSLDGASLVSGSSDTTVKLWDVQTGGVVKTFIGHISRVLSVSISADYTTVASGSDECTICLWDIETGECHYTIKQMYRVYHVTFSPTDPQHLISISNGKVWQWDVGGCEIKTPFVGWHASFSSDGTQFVSCYEKTVTAHNSSSGATVSEFQITSINTNQCSFSPDSRLVAVAADRTIYCWDITSSKPQLVETFIGHTKDITSFVFSSPTTLISVSGDKSVRFWQVGALSADSAMIDPGSIPLPSVQIMSVTLQAKDLIITSDSDGMVKTWDISTGIHKTFQTPAKSYKKDVQLINERLILVYLVHNEIHVWDAGNGKPILEVNGFYCTNDLRISGDGLKVFLLAVGSIWAWSVQTGEAVGKVNIGYSGYSGSLTVDGSKVWAHWPQSEYEGWDFGNSGSSPIQLSGMPTLSNGRMFWDPRQGRIKDAVTGKVIFQPSGRFTNPATVQCDGSYLAASYDSGEILILDLKDVIL